MITLEVSNYCHECPSFEADVIKLTANGEVIETSVKCQNRGRCHAIYITMLRNLRKGTEECQDS